MKNLHRILRRIVHQVADGGGAVTQPLQEFQQTVASVVSPPIAKKRFVNDPVVLVQKNLESSSLGRSNRLL